MSTITRPSRTASDFVSSASDAKAKAAKRAGDRRVQITLTIPREMMARLDALAEQTGQTRAGLLLLGAARVLRDGI